MSGLRLGVDIGTASSVIAKWRNRSIEIDNCWVRKITPAGHRPTAGRPTPAEPRERVPPAVPAHYGPQKTDYSVKSVRRAANVG